MSRSRTALALLNVAVLAAPLLVVVLFLMGAAATPPPPCPSVGAGGISETVGDVSLAGDQLEVAEQAVRAVREYRPTSGKPHAAVILLATGYQESRLRNLDYGDRDSLGFLQQRPSQGWGTAAQVRDVEFASRSFLRRLVEIAGWETMRVTDAAAAVQRPAEQYRGLYQQWVPMAQGLVDRLWASTSGPTPTGPHSSSQTTQGTGAKGNPAATAEGLATPGEDASVIPPASPDCAPRAYGGEVTWPVPEGMTSSDRHNFGQTGSNWQSMHTGTDFSVPCGTPVIAVTAGTVVIDHGATWAGPNLVKVSTGQGSLTTWYAHMQAVTVTAGQVVQAGQQLGEVGDQGNSTGCHLHFEVHPDGGTIYQDPVNPSAWLAQSVGKPLAD